MFRKVYLFLTFRIGIQKRGVAFIENQYNLYRFHIIYGKPPRNKCKIFFNRHFKRRRSGRTQNKIYSKSSYADIIAAACSSQDNHPVVYEGLYVWYIHNINN